jgi:hypothetical protein
MPELPYAKRHYCNECLAKIPTRNQRKDELATDILCRLAIYLIFITWVEIALIW